MDLQATAQLLGNFGEFFGAIVVVVTLMYLAYQLRQSNQLGRLEAMQAMADAWLFTGWEIAGNKEMAALLAKVGEGAAQCDFDSTENYQVFSFFFGADNNWAMRFSQLQLGILKPEDYSFPNPANPTYNSNYHREVWPTFRAEFSDEFANFWERRFELTPE
jgi:hypothetical protein